MELKKGAGTITEYNETNSTYFLGSSDIDFIWLTPLDHIQPKLKWAFSLHVYSFGCMFFVLAFFAFSSVLNIRSQISKKRFVSGINTFLCIFGLSRAASLFIDPYGSLKVFPVPITNALWAIGYPSLMSSFCLLQLAFLHLTQLKYGAKILRIEIFLRSVITFHIFFSVLRAVISSVHWSLNLVVINYLCELVFLSWTLFIFISFLYIGYQVFGLLKRVPATMLQPDGCQNKGIMQLVMLAPASNLVTSVTAALMPTLLGPAASMTSNQTTLSTAGTAITIDEKNKQSIHSATGTPSNISRQGQVPLIRTKATESFKQEMNNLRTEGPLKTKKLTWQSSIINDNKTESSLTGIKRGTNVSSKRPILKDLNRTETSEVNVKAESGENGAKFLGRTTTSAIDNDKSSQENDLLLHTILNHIAYVNRASGGPDSGLAHCSHDATPTSRKRQLKFVLKITYSTAILGFLLTLTEIFQRFGPYGLMKYFFHINDISPWTWFIFQTFCRLSELIMGAAIANITKQPTASIHRYYKHNPAMMKQRTPIFM